MNENSTQLKDFASLHFIKFMKVKHITCIYIKAKINLKHLTFFGVV